MPELLNTLFILLMIILFYAWIGVVAFFSSPEGHDDFPTLLEATWTLWICVTTANYPDVMMPGYNQSRLSGVFFVSFMLVAFYFMVNVILATVVNTYNKEVEMFAEERRRHVRENLEKAFRLLDKEGSGRIGKKTVMAIFAVMNEDCPDIRYIPHQIAELLFAILDKDGTSHITEQEFMEFGHVMLLEFETASSYETFVEQHFSKFINSSQFQKIQKIVKSERFEHVIDIILVLNAIVVFIQTFPELIGEDANENPHIADGEIDTVWEVVETVFTIIYCIEMTIKILVLGWKRYTESLRNVFDGTITILSLAATCYVYYPNAYSDSRLIRYIVMVRVLRLTRILVAMKQFQVIGRTCIDILPAASRIFWLLFCIMYCFAALGMEIFGGLVTRDPDNPLTYRFNNTAFAENEYWANNFNDMMSGMNVLFNLLVVNNWPEQADGFLAVTQTKWSRLFFLAFHVVGVMVVNNIVVAIIIDEFLGEWRKNHAVVEGVREDMDEAVLMDGGQRALFDASNITGTSTNLTGGYIARLKRRGTKLNRQDDLLRNFFIKTLSEEQKESE